jgi:hypothetical protein
MAGEAASGIVCIEGIAGIEGIEGIPGMLPGSAISLVGSAP